MSQPSPFEAVRAVWMNGELVPFEKAQVHLFSHALHYGSGWFEGIRCYETPRGPAVFRLREHMARLKKSCQIFRAKMPYSPEELEAAALDTIRANGFQSCYVRPIAYRGLGTLGVDPSHCPVDVAIGVWPWGKYLGDEAQRDGVDVCVSSWRRPDPGTMPANAKATGAYLNSQLIRLEASAGGFAEGIALDSNGNVSEGSGENIFVVEDGMLLTPPLSSAILSGITRASVLQLARDLGIPRKRRVIPRGALYTADEMFFTGTAAEVTPIRSVDHIPVGEGRPGPITRRLLEEYMAIVQGQIEDRHGWLTYVHDEAQAEPEPVAAVSEPV